MLGEYHGQEKGEINFGNSAENKINYILNLSLTSCLEIIDF